RPQQTVRRSALYAKRHFLNCAKLLPAPAPPERLRQALGFDGESHWRLYRFLRSDSNPSSLHYGKLVHSTCFGPSPSFSDLFRSPGVKTLSRIESGKRDSSCSSMEKVSPSGIRSKNTRTPAPGEGTRA